MINKTTLKNLPLVTILAAGLVLSPVLVMASQGERNSNKAHYSQNDRQSHSKADKRSSKAHYKSRDNRNKSKHGYSSKHRYNTKHGRHNDRAHYKRGFNNHRHDHHATTYVVNDHHYSDYPYGLEHLRFMIGLHTNNFDIVFRD